MVRESTMRMSEHMLSCKNIIISYWEWTWHYWYRSHKQLVSEPWMNTARQTMTFCLGF